MTPTRTDVADDRTGLTAAGGELARFLVVGASNTVVTLAAYALLLAVGLHYLTALVPAFALGTLNGYTLNRSWTFRSGPFRGAGLARYGVMQLCGLGLNAALLVVCVEELGAGRLLGQALAMPAVSLATFLTSRHWVFRERP